jgi:O-antigen ligase
VRVASGALLLAAVCLGLLAGARPAWAVLAVLGVAFAVVVLYDVFAGLCVFVFVSFTDALSAGADIPVTKGAGLILAVSWLAALATREERRPTLPTAHPFAALMLAGLVGWAGLSTMWAESAGAAQAATVRYALNAVLFVIVFTAVRERRHVVILLGVFAAGALTSAIYGVISGTTAEDPYQSVRLSGAGEDPNVLASYLAAAAAMSLGVMVALRGHPRARLLAGGAAALAVFAVFATVSRGGVVALAVMILAAIVLAGRWRAAAIVGAVAAVGLAVVYFSFASPLAAERITRETSSGRVDIWRVGLRMVEANPVVGVGADNFDVVSVQYLLRPGAIERDDLIIDTPLVAHNLYLQVLADLGAVGFVLFFSVVGFSLLCAIRAVHRFERRGDVTLEAVSRAIVIALVGILAAFFFVSEPYSKHLWLLLGLGPALLALARRPWVPPADAATRGPGGVVHPSSAPTLSAKRRPRLR